MANGLMDGIAHKNYFRGNSFWAAEAWVNIYKDKDPAKGRAFFGSTSFLAFTRNGWHLVKFIMIESISVAAAILYGPWWLYIPIRLSFHAGFWITYIKKII